jgi:hypothetical protein
MAGRAVGPPQPDSLHRKNGHLARIVYRSGAPHTIRTCDLFLRGGSQKMACAASVGMGLPTNRKNRVACPGFSPPLLHWRQEVMSLHGGQFAHGRHAQIARRASLSQGDAVACFRKSEVWSAPSRLDAEGRIAIVTTREAGMRWTQAAARASFSCGRTALTRTAKACGPGLPTLRPSRAVTIRAAMGARKPGPQGEREGNR